MKAIRKVMLGAAYQRCRVHFLRNVFTVIKKDAAEMVAATIRTIFAQPTADAVRTQLDTVADMLRKQFPKVREMLLEAKDDLTAFAAFPERHWKKSVERHGSSTWGGLLHPAGHRILVPLDRAAGHGGLAVP